ncbi:unnamed protein product [Mytilus edulis]|uniref:C1q domain-containing protein n=1 Tax=Mytilus edulis TaxID=6550 RepID=A0A8S3UUJ5_MYTED|nr:unnamed protein product [Mytilus edulis]
MCMVCYSYLQSPLVQNDNCKAAIDIPLITKVNAPLKAELDISGLTTQLKELIQNEVEKAVSVAMKDLAENFVDKRIQSALEILQTNNNRTFSRFIQELEVAITAFLSRSGKVDSRSVLKLDEVVLDIGINNLLTFKSTGKFVCEQTGLYMISVSIMSNTNGAIFFIYLNGNRISTTYIATQDKGWWHTGTTVVAVQLKIDDRLWGQTNETYVREIYSDVTIIKVK